MTRTRLQHNNVLDPQTFLRVVPANASRSERAMVVNSHSEAGAPGLLGAEAMDDKVRESIMELTNPNDVVSCR